MSILQCEGCRLNTVCKLYLKRDGNPFIMNLLDSYCSAYEPLTVVDSLKNLLDLLENLKTATEKYKKIPRRQLEFDMVDYKNICSYCKKVLFGCKARGLEVRKCKSFEPKRIDQKLPKRDEVITEDDILNLKIELGEK